VVGRPIIVGVGAVVELQAPRNVPSKDRRGRHLVPDEPDRLAVTGRLFAQTAAGERLTCERLAMGIGLWRRGRSAIWKCYVGPPPLPEGPTQCDRLLESYRLGRQDIEDAVNQMLGRDPDQHRPPRLSWSPLIELLADHGVRVSEPDLIALPFRCELSPEVQDQLPTTDSG
jgi:hypothetical protein